MNLRRILDVTELSMSEAAEIKLCGKAGAGGDRASLEAIIAALRVSTAA